MLKTSNNGQFSFFTLKPGLIRGGHYHNTKTEKFFIVNGKAKFLFKNIVTNESVKILTNANSPKIIDTIPGWAHSIENIGSQTLIGFIWANEIFDKKNPDTIVMKS
jgi:UDP-2-acetamido-2,6-beta-L-arabino-hexul-4-ose reductase